MADMADEATDFRTECINFFRDLEEIIQCPVCLDWPKRPILSCLRGHHICGSCRTVLHICPLCRSPFHGGRDFFAEGFLEKYEAVLKNRIAEERLRPPPVSVAVETQTPVPEIYHYVPCVFMKCHQHFMIENMTTHIKEKHPNTFLPKKEGVKYDAYNARFKLRKYFSTSITEAVITETLGTFFIDCEIETDSSLKWNIQHLHYKRNWNQYYEIYLNKNRFYFGTVPLMVDVVNVDNERSVEIDHSMFPNRRPFFLEIIFYEPKQESLELLFM